MKKGCVFRCDIMYEDKLGEGQRHCFWRGSWLFLPFPFWLRREERKDRLITRSVQCEDLNEIFEMISTHQQSRCD